MAPTSVPIAEQRLIGDLHTAALVGTDGTVDRYGCTRFDSPGVFAANWELLKDRQWRVYDPAVAKQHERREAIVGRLRQRTR